MKTVLASGNQGKLTELSQLLEPLGIELVSQGSLGIDAAPETASTFVENAIGKARHACLQSGLAAIADDSGISIDALNGDPGVYSARFAGNDATDADNNDKLIRVLKGHEQRGAHYFCAIVYLRHAADPTPLIASGRWDGQILSEPRGSNGFGYDPYFLPVGQKLTAAELAPPVKNQISHRGQAVAQLLALLQTIGE